MTKKNTKTEKQNIQKNSNKKELENKPDSGNISKNQTNSDNTESANFSSNENQSDLNQFDDKLKTLEAQLEEKDAKLQSLEEQILRHMAEFENFKRRKEQEKEDSVKFSLKTFFESFLPVLDSFSSAKETFEKNDLDKAVLDGFSMIYQQVLQLLDKNNVVKINALDEPFNPEFHQAIMQEESDKESQTIIKVMQEGFIYEGRVLRPAMVVVSK